jgi:hypothetical protein
VRGTLLAAAVSPDNTPHGYNLTFAFPMLMFIIIAALLYLRFRSPHRVPGQAALASARPEVAGPAHDGTTGGSTLHGGAVVEGAAGEAAEPEGTQPEGPGSAGAAQESEDGE